MTKHVLTPEGATPIRPSVTAERDWFAKIPNSVDARFEKAALKTFTVKLYDLDLRALFGLYECATAALHIWQADLSSESPFEKALAHEFYRMFYFRDAIITDAIRRARGGLFERRSWEEIELAKFLRLHAVERLSADTGVNNDLFEFFDEVAALIPNREHKNSKNGARS